MTGLTEPQRDTVRELQREIESLNLKADIEWAKYLHTQDEDCFQEVLALDSEAEMKGLIAYIPTGGERKIDKVRGLIRKVKQSGGKDCPDCELPGYESRIRALQSVNEWRATYELPPLDRLPRGLPGDAGQCTLAKAIHMSAVEMGLENIDVQVESDTSIHLQALRSDGSEVMESGFLDPKSAGEVIESFDENAWLDLLSDGALQNYAQDRANMGDEYDRLQEVADELTRRGLRMTVTLPYYDDAEIRIGKGCRSVRQSLTKLDDKLAAEV